MREKITIRSDGNSWKMILPGFGLNQATVLEFKKWPDAIDYINRSPRGSSGSYERASQYRDGIGTVPGWSPFRW